MFLPDPITAETPRFSPAAASLSTSLSRGRTLWALRTHYGRIDGAPRRRETMVWTPSRPAEGAAAWIEPLSQRMRFAAVPEIVPRVSCGIVVRGVADRPAPTPAHATPRCPSWLYPRRSRTSPAAWPVAGLERPRNPARRRVVVADHLDGPTLPPESRASRWSTGWTCPGGTWMEERGELFGGGAATSVRCWRAGRSREHVRNRNRALARSRLPPSTGSPRALQREAATARAAPASQ